MRSVFDLSALVPLYRVTAFGRAIVDLELVLRAVLPGAVQSPCGWIGLSRERRSIAELIAGCGAAARGAPRYWSYRAPPDTRRRPSPRGLTLLFDWLHLAAGSVWLGGLVGVLVLWFGVARARARAGAVAVACPRFSNVAVGSVLALAATGVGEAVDHMPAVNALWETGYGRAILVKTGSARRERC